MGPDSNTHAKRRVCIRLPSISACSTECSLHGLISQNPLTKKAAWSNQAAFLVCLPAATLLQQEALANSKSLAVQGDAAQFPLSVAVQSLQFLLALAAT